MKKIQTTANDASMILETEARARARLRVDFQDLQIGAGCFPKQINADFRLRRHAAQFPWSKP
jgi:hypothetical protein